MSSYPSAKDSLDSQRDPHHTHAPDSPNGLSQQMALTTLDGQPEEEWNELLNEPWQTTYEVFNTSLGNVNAPTQQAPYPMSTADFGHHPTSASSGTSSISFRSNNSQENVSTLFNNDNNNAYPPSFFSTQEINYGDPFDFLNRTYHKEDEPVNFNFDQPPLGNMFDYRPAATHLPPTNTAFHHPTILDAGAMSTFENVPARASEEVDASPELDQDQSDINEPCYAQLLYKCLSDAPQHTLSLKELYQWVVLHSQKGKDPEIKGWMNSVRHNLSMNAVSNVNLASPHADTNISRHSSVSRQAQAQRKAASGDSRRQRSAPASSLPRDTARIRRRSRREEVCRLPSDRSLVQKVAKQPDEQQQGVRPSRWHRILCLPDEHLLASASAIGAMLPA